MPLGGSGQGGGGKSSSSAIKAGEAFVEVTAKDSVTVTLEKIANKFKRTGAVIAGIGGALAASGTLVLAPLLGLFKEAANRADNIQDIADRLDATTESVSRLGYAAELSGSNLEQLEGASKLLSKATQAAAKGSEEQVAAFALMGVTAEEFAAMDLDKRFLLIAESLDTLGDPLQKNRLLLALFGKSGAQLKPLFKDGAEGLRELLGEADKVGATVSSEDGKKAAKVMDALDRSMKALKYGFLSIGAAIFDVAGGVENASKVIINIVATVRGWIERNRALVLTVTAVAAGVVAAGLAIAAIGGIIAAVGFVISSAIAIWTALGAALTAVVSIGGAIIGIVFSPITIAVVALAAVLAGLVVLFLQLGDSVGALSALKQWFSGIGEAFNKSIGGIMNALKKGDLNLAWEIALKGLQVAWQETVMIFLKIWNGFKRVFVDGFKIEIAGLRMLWVGFFDFIKLALLTHIKFILDKFMWVSNKIGATQLLDKLGANPQELIGALDREIDATVAALDKKIEPIRDELKEDLARRASERQQDIDSQQGLINQLKGDLDTLVAKATEPEAVVKKAEGLGLLGRNDNAQMLQQLGRVIAGTFRSADYRGSLAIQSMVKDENKKQTKIQEGIRDKLGDIDDKLDDMEGAEFE